MFGSFLHSLLVENSLWILDFYYGDFYWYLGCNRLMKIQHIRKMESNLNLWFHFWMCFAHIIVVLVNLFSSFYQIFIICFFQAILYLFSNLLNSCSLFSIFLNYYNLTQVIYFKKSYDIYFHNFHLIWNYFSHKAH